MIRNKARWEINSGNCILEFDNDGTAVKRVYARGIINNGAPHYEYLIITWSDDGLILNAIELANGKAIDRTTDFA